MEIQGNTGTTTVRVGQDIGGDLSAGLRHKCTFSAYLYNNTGLSIIPQLVLATANAFNNPAATTDVSTTNLQSCPSGLWTYVTDTVDLTNLANVANGLSVIVALPGVDTATKNVLFSRTKFQLGEIATPFTDDVSLFVQIPSVGAAQLQDGCIARPSLFLSNVVPLGAYVDKSITDPKIADNTILARSLSTGIVVVTGNTNTTVNVTAITPNTTGLASGMPISGSGIPGGATIAAVVSSSAITLSAAASTSVTGVTLAVTAGTSATVGNLGYTPENKAGDVCTGVHVHNQDTVINSTSYSGAAISIGISSANASNAGYMPAIGFLRPGIYGRALGLNNADSRFKTVDSGGVVGYLLDTVTGVDTNSYQNGSITYAKLAQSLINLICPVGMIILYPGPNPPVGYLNCDGSAVSRTTFAALFQAIGVYWGGGDGVNTFNVPNLLSRTAVGYGGGYSLASLGGEATHTLSVGELAFHGHGVSDPMHGHVFHDPGHAHSYVNPTGGFSGQAGSSQYSASGSTGTSAATTGCTMDLALTQIGIQGSGSNTPHNNMQPYAVVWYIIKAS
jgi:microcystin-dependent protein